MFLKSIQLEHYRKFEKKEKIEFAHDSWNSDNTDNSKEVAEYISKSSTLIIGGNNSGKSTIINLLATIQKCKSGSRNIFSYNDFNLKYLKRWYDDNVFKSQNESNTDNVEKYPYLEFILEIGVDENEDIISNLEKILVVGDINETNSNNKQTVVTIKMRYELADTEKFKKALKDLEDDKAEISKLMNTGIRDDISMNGEVSTRKEIEDKENSQISKDDNLKIRYRYQYLYRKFLEIISKDYFVLNFYSLNSDTPVQDFTLAPLIKVKTIEANSVKNKDTLSRAYNKIVNTYIKNNGIEDFKKFIIETNYKLLEATDNNIKSILQNSIKTVESTKNLEMNLHPNITFEKIFEDNIVYEYIEDGNYIPEDQFGMGYTNLMVIIANIVDYINLYDGEDIHGAINILCIEEPETFMHPQMQELFIKNISKAITKLLGKVDKKTFQMVISTHSTHILNGKIHSGNTLDNIVYMNSKYINNDRNITNLLDSLLEEDTNEMNYIKKYISLELTDIFFADAVIFVEGPTEEMYIKYLISERELLQTHHIKVFSIDGAYAHKLSNLLETLGVKTIIYTDLDLKRNKSEKDVKKNDPNSMNIKNVTEKYSGKDCCLTTNQTLKEFVAEFKKEDIEDINSKIFELLKNNSEFLKVTMREISVYSQGKILGSYATSFEEALILTNCVEKYESKLECLLEQTLPRTDCIKLNNIEDKRADYSYYYQVKLSDKKRIFATNLIKMLMSSGKDSLLIPRYIEEGLKEIEEYFGDEKVEHGR